MTRLTEAQARYAISRKEFGKDIIESAPAVAVVLTQQWCPQWLWMRAYLERLPASPERRIFYIEYDLEPYFEEFLAFKEDSLGNREIPYIRYYRDGRLSSTGNFIARDGFLRKLGEPEKRDDLG